MKFIRFDFGLQLDNHAELNTETTSVVITRANGIGKKKIETSILKSSKLRMVTQNASQNLAKISSKSSIVHKTMNICRKFVFREILNEARPVALRGDAFPALFFFFFFFFLGGFHENGNTV